MNSGGSRRDDRRGLLLVHDHAVRRLLRGRTGPRRSADDARGPQRLAIAAGVDDDPGRHGRAVGQHDADAVAVHHAPGDHRHAGQAGVEVGAQPRDVQDGVLPAELPRGQGDGPTACAGGDGGLGEIGGELVAPGAVGEPPGPPRIGVDQRGAQPTQGAGAGERPAGRSGADDRDVVHRPGFAGRGSTPGGGIGGAHSPVVPGQPRRGDLRGGRVVEITAWWRARRRRGRAIGRRSAPVGRR